MKPKYFYYTSLGLFIICNIVWAMCRFPFYYLGLERMIFGGVMVLISVIGLAISVKQDKESDKKIPKGKIIALSISSFYVIMLILTVVINAANGYLFFASK